MRSRSHLDRDNLFFAIYPAAKRAARAHSSRVGLLLRRLGLEREEAVQSAMVGLYLELMKFDPNRASLSTYTDRVVSAQIVSFIRRSTTKKHAPINEAIQIITVAEPFLIELSIDVRRALASLGRTDQVVAGLRLAHSPTEIARKLGWSRAAVYRSLGRIRQRFKDAGLQKYLAGPDRTTGFREYSF